MCMFCRLRVSPDKEDLRELTEEEPASELGLDLPELHPTAARSSVADSAMDTDTDITAHQRYVFLAEACISN